MRYVSDFHFESVRNFKLAKERGRERKKEGEKKDRCGVRGLMDNVCLTLHKQTEVTGTPCESVQRNWRDGTYKQDMG